MRIDNDNVGKEWEEIYASYNEELKSFVYARLDEGEAADLLQEIWASLSSTLTTQIIAQPRAWLYKVTRNRITDVHRRDFGKPAFQDFTPELNIFEEDTDYPDPDDAWIEMEQAIAALPEDQKAVFVRNELDGETLREIAEDLGLPLKTVISRKGYARRKLQNSLQELYDDYFGVD